MPETLFLELHFNIVNKVTPRSFLLIYMWNWPLHWGNKWSITIEYIFLYSWCTIKTTIWQSSLFFVRCLLSSLAFTTPSPPPPRHKTLCTYVVYVYSDMALSKGHLGSRGGASKNKLKDISFALQVTNVTILSKFRTFAQEGYCKVLEMNITSILYSLAL